MTTGYIGRQGRLDWNDLVAVALVGLFVLSSGCATYSDRLVVARESAALGDYESGVAEMNRALSVASADEFPSDFAGDHALAALDRASLLQATLAFEDSASNLTAADEELEILDISGDAIGELGRYVYSDSAGAYKIPPSERLALNAVNMLNFLALDDLQGSAVEARRFTVVREYLEALELPAPGSVFGSYFAGLTFEKLGQGNRALRYYEEALGAGSLATLSGPVSRLAAIYPHRGPGIRKLLKGAAAASSAVASAASPSEIVVVMSLGRVPYKIPERIPIGAAVGLAGAFISGNPAVLEHSILKVVVYPELTPSNSAAVSGSVVIDGTASPVELLVDLREEIRSEYEALKPQIIGAAVSRMIVRAAAAEGMRFAGRQAGGGAGDALGFLTALITEGALVAFDKPDTRSWSFLPEQIFISRLAVSPGEHRVEVAIAGEGVVVKRDFEVSVPRGKVAVVVVTEPR